MSSQTRKRTRGQHEIASAIITGASKGLGRALFVNLAKRGVRVVGVARPSAWLSEAHAEARAASPNREKPNAFVIAANVGERGVAARIALEAASLVGDVDLVIHNASALGPVPLLPLADVDEATLARVLDVNVIGPLSLTRAVVGGMVVRNRGDIVFISSDAAVDAYPTWGPYGASKAAADHAARVLAAELEGTNVRVLAIDPGEMDTDMHRDALPEADPKTLQRPVDVAERILRIVDDSERFPSGRRVRALDLVEVK